MSRSFFVRVCMFTVSNALLMSSATAMVRAVVLAFVLLIISRQCWILSLSLVGSVGFCHPYH